MLISNLYKLTATVKNPEYSKRNKYGPEAVPEYPKGTVLVFGEGALGEFGYMLADDNMQSVSYSTLKTLKENSVPYEPETAQEILAMHHMLNAWTAYEVLNTLIAQGIVGTDQLKNITGTVIARMEESDNE